MNEIQPVTLQLTRDEIDDILQGQTLAYLFKISTGEEVEIQVSLGTGAGSGEEKKVFFMDTDYIKKEYGDVASEL